MLPNFTALMSNVLEMGPYDDICHPDLTGPEMLIVQVQNDVLRISDAAKIDSAGADVLSNYTAVNSMYGICSKDRGATGSGFRSASTMEFLLVREIPAGAPLDGSFFPVDGCASVTVPALIYFRGATLTAAGRHDIGGSKRSWRFTAIQEPRLFRLPDDWEFRFERPPNLPLPIPWPTPWPEPDPFPWPEPGPQPWSPQAFEAQGARLASTFIENVDHENLLDFTGNKISAKKPKRAARPRRKKG